MLICLPQDGTWWQHKLFFLCWWKVSVFWIFMGWNWCRIFICNYFLFIHYSLLEIVCYVEYIFVTLLVLYMYWCNVFCFIFLSWYKSKWWMQFIVESVIAFFCNKNKFQRFYSLCKMFLFCHKYKVLPNFFSSERSDVWFIFPFI